MKPLLAILVCLGLAACAETRPYANVGVGVGGGDIRVTPSLTLGGRYGAVTVYR
ncbi:hypothetical protein LX81_01978 [Palleronia aestuarii]|uniref:Lipoprotein n=1 Tax=Palleronia aestuarii TaxID=568105 RepID=A0A2W7NTE7_9RHOB|nr:hypothetical protein LX81_01978 [Palleronia aestuarii]